MATYQRNCLKPLSNHIVHDRDLVHVQPSGCSMRLALRSATFFSVSAPGESGPSRRCLLSLSMIITPGRELFLSNFTCGLDFLPQTAQQPSIIGYQFIDPEKDTNFLKRFKYQLRKSPAELDGTWFTAGFHELFTGEDCNDEENGFIWGDSHAGGSLIVIAPGESGRVPGIVRTVPLCLLLDLHEGPPPAIVANIYLAGFLATMHPDGVRPCLDYRAGRYRSDHKAVLITHVGPLPMVLGDPQGPNTSRSLNVQRLRGTTVADPIFLHPQEPTLSTPQPVPSDMATRSSTPRVSQPQSSTPTPPPLEAISEAAGSHGIRSAPSNTARDGSAPPMAPRITVTLATPPIVEFKLPNSARIKSVTNAINLCLQRLGPDPLPLVLQEGEKAFLATMKNILGQGYPTYVNCTWRDCRKVVRAFFANASVGLA